MNKKIINLSLCLIAGTSLCMAANTLSGFSYGNAEAPAGNEWESPESLAYNKEQPRATFWTFESLDKARLVLPQHSEYRISLDGEWKFHWSPTPDDRIVDFYKPDFNVSSWDNIEVPSNWNIAGIRKDGSKKYGTPIYVNQPVIFYHQVKPGDWKGGVMRTPPETWTTYKDRNEVGSYRRTFMVPEDWKDRECYIQFDGVDSFFYLWINGKYVGFSKNSRNAARFDISRFLVAGENMVAVEVYRNSDGSFLEAQDMFRLPGIFRSVSVFSTSKIQIRDFRIIPDLTNDYTDGALAISTDIRNLTGKDAKDLKITYRLYQNRLYSDENTPVENAVVVTTPFNVSKGGESSQNITMEVKNPKKWSAEQPWRYTLVAQLSDKTGKVLETVSAYVGFRKVELKEMTAEEDEFGLAGKYFLVNGKPVKLKGVNRHETNPSTGHYINHDRMLEEVMMMKRANINHVRNSHYPDDPYWYYLTDKYGIYLEDEANLESHEYYYGDASLSHVPEFRDAHVARNLEMVRSNVNSPSIVIWSLGNEAGPGENFVEAYNALKEFDDSRPVQYERNNNIVDIGSNQYPSVDWVRWAVKGDGNIKYPFHISEYAHSMGNAVGNLVDYWEAIESTNHFMGGAIWDWIDQSLYNYDAATGEKYLGFGGDFGDYPNGGQFVMNGIIFGDMAPKPQYWEVKKVYQNVGVSKTDSLAKEIAVFNKNYFTPLDSYEVVWTLMEDGNPIQTGKLDKVGSVNAREKKNLPVPFDDSKLKPESEYFLDIEFRLAENTPWAEKGYVQMAEQLPVKSASGIPGVGDNQSGKKPSVSKDGNMINVTGENFKAQFDVTTGTLYSLLYDGKNIIVPGHGPELDAFRAYLNNDNWASSQWFANGLYNLKHKVTAFNQSKDKNGNPVLSFTVESQAPNGGKMQGNNGNTSGLYSIDEEGFEPFSDEDFKLTANQVWTIYPDGSIEMNASIGSNMPWVVLPRLGYTLEVPDNFATFTYYGRGPEENYNDRKTGQFVGKYSAQVKDMATEYTRPQSNGNREEVRWAALTDGNEGVLFVAPEGMSATAIPYTEMEIFKANHPYKLPNTDRTVMHLDLGVTGLGGNSCGQGGPLKQDRVMADRHRFSFIIRPAMQAQIEQKAKVTGSGVIPEEVVINLPEKADLEAIYTSSFEPDYGEGTNLTDGDPTTIWHTMYSVTVAAYPHWVDFDAGEQKVIEGFSYLPRQDDNNTGNVKDYEIYVSDNTDDWGSPVAKGSFENNFRKKKVMFDKPVKGRYIRFKALNAQNGREYASGAEFEIITPK